MRIFSLFEMDGQFVEVYGHRGYKLLKPGDTLLLHLELLGRKK